MHVFLLDFRFIFLQVYLNVLILLHPKKFEFYKISRLFIFQIFFYFKMVIFVFIIENKIKCSRFFLKIKQFVPIFYVLTLLTLSAVLEDLKSDVWKPYSKSLFSWRINGVTPNVQEIYIFIRVTWLKRENSKK